MIRTDTETTLKILARIARGDTMKAISADTGVAVATIHDIKKRNASALETIKGRLIDHEIATSQKILSKAHGIIEKRLDKASQSENLREELRVKLSEGEIDWKEYRARLDQLYEPTLTELNAVAREAFSQSQIEQGKPTSISSSPNETKQQLVDLVEALNKGDEVELFKMVISPNAHEAIQEGEVVA